MAKYRFVYTEFWNDPDVLEVFTPEDKLFYLYLLTNRNTSQIGIYQITKKQMAFEMGYSLEAINAMMDRFINKHELVLYDEETREICVKNWGKYNLFKDGKPIADAVASDIAKVRNATFLRYPAMYAEADSIKGLLDCATARGTTRGQKGTKSKLKESEVNNNAHSASAGDVESDFEDWWVFYDRKKDKKRAFTSFKRCHKKHGYESIKKGTELYLKTITDKQYQKHPTTFLNGENYLDIEGMEEDLKLINRKQVQQYKNPELTEQNKRLIQERKVQRERDLESGYMPF